MNTSKKRNKLRKKRYYLPVTVIVLLIAARIALPYFVKKHVNQVLADLPGYYGQVADIDISLYRGAYTIDGLYLNKVSAGSQVPFLDFKKTDISIEWKSLFKGKIVSEIIMNEPKIRYVFEDHTEESKDDPEVEDWTKALTDLVPIDINHLQVTNGMLAFVQLSADPNIDLQFNKIDLDAKNLKNIVRADQKLPSSVTATAVSIGQGKVRLDGKMDIVKQIPDVDISFALENSDVTSLNDFTTHYASIDFKNGKFSIFSELAIADGYLKGYIKPMLKDSELIGKDDGFLDVLWEGFIGFFKFALKNQKNDTLATKIPLEGDLTKVESNVWVSVISIFENAWINAFKEKTDDSINFEDAQKATE